MSAVDAPVRDKEDRDAAEERTVASTYTRSRATSNADFGKEENRTGPIDIEAADVEKTEEFQETHDVAEPLTKPDFPEGGLAAWLTVLGA